MVARTEYYKAFKDKSRVDQIKLGSYQNWEVKILHYNWMQVCFMSILAKCFRNEFWFNEILSPLKLIKCPKISRSR